MFSFIVRRLFYCLLVLLGVVLLTFLLFNVAAGDPAAAVLGKNPTAQEVEELRRELGSDLPLCFGSRRRTEAFNGYDAAAGKTVGSVEVRKNSPDDEWEQEFVFHRNFQTPDEEVEMVWEADGGGRIEIAGTDDDGKIAPETDEVTIRVASTGRLTNVDFYRPNSSVLNSQFVRALGEIITLNGEKPYVHLLDFGRTLVTREPIGRILRRGVVPSLCLMMPIFLGELVIGVMLALAATAFRDTWIDRILLLLSISMMSISYLVVIIFAQWILGYYYNIFPVWGWGSAAFLILPVLIGVACGLGGSVRFYRSVFVNELNREYLRTAKAKGCSPFAVYSRHLLRNAMIPIITRAGSILPFLFTGSLLLESFFGIPGLGYAGLDALYNSDLQLLKALVVVSALLFVAINLLTDIVYAWADPRIRLK